MTNLEGEPEEARDRLGVKMFKFRTARSLSQKSLAEEMRARGWRWSQPTVAAIEQGDRPLRANELPDLVQVFGLESVDDFYETGYTDSARLAFLNLEEKKAALRDVAQEYMRQQWALATRIDQVEAAGEPYPASEEDLRAILSMTPEDVVRAAELLPETPADRLAKGGLEFLNSNGEWELFGNFANGAAWLRWLIERNPDSFGKRQQPRLSPKKWRKPRGEHPEAP